MAAKQLLFDEEARRNIKNGIKKLADAVRVTMGPWIPYCYERRCYRS